MKARRVSDEMKARIKRLFSEGRSVPQISAEVGVSRFWLYQFKKLLENEAEQVHNESTDQNAKMIIDLQNRLRSTEAQLMSLKSELQLREKIILGLVVKAYSAGAQA